MHSNITEESQRLRLVSSPWMGARALKELVGECAGVLDAAYHMGQETGMRFLEGAPIFE